MTDMGLISAKRPAASFTLPWRGIIYLTKVHNEIDTARQGGDFAKAVEIVLRVLEARDCASAIPLVLAEEICEELSSASLIEAPET